MDKLLASTQAYRKQFLDLLEHYVKAQEIVTKKFHDDEAHANAWRLIQEHLNYMKFFIDGEQIPKQSQKDKPTCTEILTNHKVSLSPFDLNYFKNLDLLFNNLCESALEKTEVPVNNIRFNK